MALVTSVAANGIMQNYLDLAALNYSGVPAIPGPGNQIFEADSEVEMLALAAILNDRCERSDNSKGYRLAGSDPSILANWLEVVSGLDYPAAFADAYDAYAAAGVVLGAANTGGTKSIIEDELRNPGISVATLAQAFADYWATVAVSPGTPAHGGTSVVSVVNNSASLVSAFAAAITASLRATESTPYFEEFISNIEDVVLTIQWTVTETILTPSPVPTPFIELIT